MFVQVPTMDASSKNMAQDDENCPKLVFGAFFMSDQHKLKQATFIRTWIRFNLWGSSRLAEGGSLQI